MRRRALIQKETADHPHMHADNPSPLPRMHLGITPMPTSPPHPPSPSPHPASPADGGQRAGLKAPHSQNRAQRLHAAKQQREAKRAHLLAQRRLVVAPRVVLLLPLSAWVDVQPLWSALVTACASGGTDAVGTQAPEQQRQQNGGGGDAMETEQHAQHGMAPLDNRHPLAPRTLFGGGKGKQGVTLLSPPVDRSDPLALIDAGKAADLVLLVLSGDAGAAEAVDDEGRMALAVLRALGMPSVAALVRCSGGGGEGEGDAHSMHSSMSSRKGVNPMRNRAAAKRRCAAALEQHVGDSCGCACLACMRFCPGLL
jgi:hypothetical protein